jgi:hypothetical protein
MSTMAWYREFAYLLGGVARKGKASIPGKFLTPMKLLFLISSSPGDDAKDEDGVRWFIWIFERRGQVIYLRFEGSITDTSDLFNSDRAMGPDKFQRCIIK